MVSPIQTCLWHPNRGYDDDHICEQNKHIYYLWMLDTGEKKQKSVRWGLPGGPVDETLCSHCRGLRFDPWAWTKKKKKKYKTIFYKKTQNKEKLINAILKAFFFCFLQIRKRLMIFPFFVAAQFLQMKHTRTWSTRWILTMKVKHLKPRKLVRLAQAVQLRAAGWTLGQVSRFPAAELLPNGAALTLVVSPPGKTVQPHLWPVPALTFLTCKSVLSTCT